MLLDNLNALSGGGRDYGWDQQNRLKAVTKDGTTVRFTYRPDGLRARKEVVGGLTIDYVYDGQTVIGEKRNDGKSVWYTPGPNGYINRTVVNDATGQVLDKEWFVYDGLGSCRALVKPNAAGTDAVIVARYDYDVYGAVRTQSGSSSNKFKYVAGIGHPTDEETGLIYMRARYYDPQVGRFVSEDPAGHGENWFVYAANNPVSNIDPDGRMSLSSILIGGLLAGLMNIGFQYALYGDINWIQVFIAVIGGAAGAAAGGLYADRVLAALGEGSTLSIGQKLIRWLIGGATRTGVKGLGGALFVQQGHRELDGPLGKVLAAHAGNMFVLDILVNFLEDGIQGLF